MLHCAENRERSFCGRQPRPWPRHRRRSQELAAAHLFVEDPCRDITASWSSSLAALTKTGHAHLSVLSRRGAVTIRGTLGTRAVRTSYR
jgi:hypothetical protein